MMTVMLMMVMYDDDDVNLMRLDTAGVERNPPFPTINFDTLFAAAILL